MSKNRTIWKFPIGPGEFTLRMPVVSTILHVATQHGDPFMWVLVNTTAPEKERRFVVHGTGHDVMVGSLKHIGTFLVESDALVFHVFEVLA